MGTFKAFRQYSLLSLNHLVSFSVALLLGGCAEKAQEPFSSAAKFEQKVVGDEGFSLGGGVQIICESFSSGRKNTAVLSEDWASSVLLAPGQEGDSEAPVILRSLGGYSEVLSISGASIYWSIFDHAKKQEIIGKRQRVGVALPMLAANKAFRQLGLGRVRTYAASPGQSQFLFGVKGKYSLRLSENPLLEIASWNINPDLYFNPRWEEGKTISRDIIFFDYLEKGNIRQAFAQVSKNNLVRMENLPAPIWAGAQQMGLRRYDRSNLVWLEWKNGKALLRMMDLLSRQSFEMEFPDENISFSAGLAVLHEDKIGHLFMLLAKDGLYQYRLNFGELEFVAMLPYTNEMLSDMPEAGWRFGAIYSASGDTKVFTVMPASGGGNKASFLFSLESASRFKRLGDSSCENPSFFEGK